MFPTVLLEAMMASFMQSIASMCHADAGKNREGLRAAFVKRAQEHSIFKTLLARLLLKKNRAFSCRADKEIAAVFLLGIRKWQVCLLWVDSIYSVSGAIYKPCRWDDSKTAMKYA